MGRPVFNFNRDKNNILHWSPLRYPGGKTALHPVFNEMLLKKGISNATYVEPFAGGAGAALALLMQNKVRRIVINDIDRAIYSFWMSSVYRSESFIRKMYRTPISIKERTKQKTIYQNPNSNEFKLGFATFYLNRTNVSGIIGGGVIGGEKQKGKWKINARFNKKALAKKIRTIAKRKKDIRVLKNDGIKLLGVFLGKKNIFIYLDPPYFEKGAMLYLNAYQKEHHEALAKRLNQSPKALWVLSYDDHKEIRSLYPKRKIIPFGFKHHASSAKTGREIAVLSDTLAALRA